jgi:O-succinylhomoserine sulfhydrylase
MNKKLHPETEAIRIQSERSPHREHSGSIYLTSSFLFDDAEHMRAMFADEVEGNIYSRFSNPNADELTKKLCALEEGEDGYVFATGMSAVYTTFAALLKQGDHILSSRAIFGSTHSVFTKLLPKFGITTSYADGNNPSEWESLVRPETKMIYAETPSNPGLDIIDLEWLGNFAKKHKLILVIDNCFATPYLQKPLNFGAHLSIHSATKFIDGQGRVLGGAVIGKKELMDEIRFYSRHSGPAISPFNAWILSKSLETLHVRMDRHCENALTIAERLEGHSEINFVRYPFLKSHPGYEVAKKQMTMGGGLVCFELKGDVLRGKRFLDSLQICSVSANLGDTRTIVTHPASTTHSKLTAEEKSAVGISDGLVRVSVGLEHPEDILNDILQAIEISKEFG